MVEKKDLDALDELLLTKDLPTLVEGKNDVKALKELGFLFVFSLDGPLFEMVEFLERYKEVSLLLDLDKGGDILFKVLKHELSQKGVRINVKARKALAKTPVRQVEDLTRFMKNKGLL